jgi:hypothetical protein
MKKLLLTVATLLAFAGVAHAGGLAASAFAGTDVLYQEEMFGTLPPEMFGTWCHVPDTTAQAANNYLAHYKRGKCLDKGLSWLDITSNKLHHVIVARYGTTHEYCQAINITPHNVTHDATDTLVSREGYFVRYYCTIDNKLSAQEIRLSMGANDLLNLEWGPTPVDTTLCERSAANIQKRLEDVYINTVFPIGKKRGVIKTISKVSSANYHDVDFSHEYICWASFQFRTDANETRTLRVGWKVKANTDRTLHFPNHSLQIRPVSTE